MPQEKKREIYQTGGVRGVAGNKRIQLNVRTQPASCETGFRRKLRGFKAISFRALGSAADCRKLICERQLRISATILSSSRR